MDVLVVGAHPDDVEFGMGGSLLRFAEQGVRLSICVLTRGEAGTFGTPRSREEEMRRAAAVTGASIDILDLEDCKVADSYEHRVELARVIRARRPAVIFAPSPVNPHGHRDGAAHPDHLAAGQLVRAAARYARFRGLREIDGEPWNALRILSYMVPRGTSPTLFVDVTPVMERWEALCRCHESQMQIRDGKVLEHLRELRRSWGALAGVEYAEAFHSEDPVPLDIRSLTGG